jgi:hypothetical protein
MTVGSSTGRARVIFIALAFLTIAIGLVVHLAGGALPPAFRDVLGDALWASMIFWWVGAVSPRASVVSRGVVAAGICFAVELSQMIRTPALDSIRETTLGHLFLGSDFDPRDLAAYAAGVLVAVLIERGVLSAQRKTG